MAHRILITRPEPGALTTAEAVHALGLEPVLLPLTAIVPLPQAPMTDAQTFDAVAVTSANALRHAVRTTLQPLLPLPCHAVGPTTATAAAHAGFPTVVQGGGSAADLARQITEAMPDGARIAYLCGRVRLPGFEAALQAGGLEVTSIETYDTKPINPSDAALRRAFSNPVDCVLVYSALAADAFLTLAQRPTMANHLAKAEAFCISARVASRLESRFAGRIHVAPRPDDDALLAMLA